ncbi:putative F-box protein PP2-B12 isoform X2 [Primulina huaijiensis]|uniref:putative F-box protein PP2-B12 isoform X2 n=1 Tax=Primulina huaijiensis TaxID=1492673 RepID=UPI003CC78951
MSQNYDNWERLVRAVMRDEENRRIAMRPSMESVSYISSASSSFRASSAYNSPIVNGSFSFSQTFEFPAVNPNDHETMARSEPLRVFVDQRTGKSCYVVGARGLEISSVEDSQSWKWTTQTDSSDRFLDVAELQAVWWLDIRCKIRSQVFPQRRTYEAHLIYKLAKKLKGLESAKAMVRFINDETEKDAEKRACIVHFDPEENRRGSTVVKRDDGWMEVEMGRFYIGQGENGEVEARLFEKSWNFLKSGLIVGGVEFRPSFRYSDNPIVSKQCLSRIVMA